MKWTDLHISNGSLNQVHRRADKMNTRVLVQCVGKVNTASDFKQCLVFQTMWVRISHKLPWCSVSSFLIFWCACEMHKRFKSPQIETLIPASHSVMNVCFCWPVSLTSNKRMEQNSSWETKNDSPVWYLPISSTRSEWPAKFEDQYNSGLLQFYVTVRNC